VGHGVRKSSSKEQGSQVGIPIFFLLFCRKNNISIALEFDRKISPWTYSLRMGMVVMFGHAFPFAIDIENYKCATG
jgi:hypothetical protein